MTPISQVKPVSTIEMHNDVAILITPIINGTGSNARQTGTRFSFSANGLRRQTFSLEAAKAMIDDILATTAPVEANPLVEVATQAKRQAALRGGIGDPKSATPFG
jgi:hypothetical protein